MAVYQEERTLGVSSAKMQEPELIQEIINGSTIDHNTFKEVTGIKHTKKLEILNWVHNVTFREKQFSNIQELGKFLTGAINNLYNGNINEITALKQQERQKAAEILMLSDACKIVRNLMGNVATNRNDIKQTKHEEVALINIKKQLSYINFEDNPIIKLWDTELNNKERISTSIRNTIDLNKLSLRSLLEKRNVDTVSNELIRRINNGSETFSNIAVTFFELKVKDNRTNLKIPLKTIEKLDNKDTNTQIDSYTKLLQSSMRRFISEVTGKNCMRRIISTIPAKIRANVLSKILEEEKTKTKPNEYLVNVISEFIKEDIEASLPIIEKALFSGNNKIKNIIFNATRDILNNNFIKQYDLPITTILYFKVCNNLNIFEYQTARNTTARMNSKEDTLVILNELARNLKDDKIEFSGSNHRELMIKEAQKYIADYLHSLKVKARRSRIKNNKSE